MLRHQRGPYYRQFTTEVAHASAKWASDKRYGASRIVAAVTCRSDFRDGVAP